MIVITGAAGFGFGVTQRTALACTAVGRELEE